MRENFLTFTVFIHYYLRMKFQVCTSAHPSREILTALHAAKRVVRHSLQQVISCKLRRQKR